MTNTNNTGDNITNSTEPTVELIQSGQFHNLHINGQMMVSYDENKNELAVYSADKHDEKVQVTIEPESGEKTQ